MDFTNRGGQPTAAPTQSAPKFGGKKLRGSKGMRIISAILLVSIACLIAAIVGYITFGNDGAESSFVKKDKFQAVFLNGGQVYFGKIKNLNSQYITLDNIYYLRVNGAEGGEAQAENAAAQDVSLAKLGCELHGPEDNMVINRDQVSFWENLKGDGQVATAITAFVKANPQGQKCDAATPPATN